MTWMLVLYGVVPLALFVLVDVFAGVKWAVATAALAALADIFITRAATGEWDPGSCLAFALVLGLGWVTVRLDNTLYFKLQPVVMAILFALILVYYQLLAGESLISRYLPLMRQLAPPEYRKIVDQPQFYKLMDEMLTWMIGFFLVYAAIMAVAARKWSNVTWLLLRGVGFWVLLLAFALIFFVVTVATMRLPA